MEKRFMNMAIREAIKAYRLGEVPVGAVVVKDGEVISKAFNETITMTDASSHAEILAIRRACEKLENYRLTGCDLYVTLEPCMMCLGAILEARIKNLYIGLLDYKKGACISKMQLHNSPLSYHKLDVFYEESKIYKFLLQNFFKTLRNK